jgi:hypothetical protein
MAEPIDRDELRQLIREALKEALGEPATASHDPSPNLSSQGGAERAQRRPSPLPTSSQRGNGQAAHFPSGLLNEAKVAELGRTHSKIIIGDDVAVTPLARDRAREIKVEIVRQKP